MTVLKGVTWENEITRQSSSSYSVIKFELYRITFHFLSPSEETDFVRQ